MQHINEVKMQCSSDKRDNLTTFTLCGCPFLRFMYVDVHESLQRKKKVEEKFIITISIKLLTTIVRPDHEINNIERQRLFCEPLDTFFSNLVFSFFHLQMQ